MFWLWPVMAVMARIGLNYMCQIQLGASSSVPFFQRRPGSFCAKPAWIQSGWPGQTRRAKSIWSKNKLVCKNHLAWFWQNVTSLLPVSHLQAGWCFFTDILDHFEKNQPGSDLVLADSVGFCPNGSGLEASWCAGIIRPASGLHCRFGSDANQIRHVYWVPNCSFVSMYNHCFILAGDFNHWEQPGDHRPGVDRFREDHAGTTVHPGPLRRERRVLQHHCHTAASYCCHEHCQARLSGERLASWQRVWISGWWMVWDLYWHAGFFQLMFCVSWTWSDFLDHSKDWFFLLPLAVLPPSFSWQSFDVELVL